MIDYNLIEENVRNQLTNQLSDSNGIEKLSQTIIDASIKTTIATLKEYEKQKSTNT